MSVLDRFGQVVKSEWNARFGRDGDDRDVDKEAAAEVEAALAKKDAALAPRVPPARAATVTDVDGAMRVLELSGHPTLDEVRARYRELARRYHPKTVSSRSDDVEAAHVVLESLTSALELLEEHLLPLPPA
ncbi:MAG TPA: J domain-containing protein [Myxococcota bacterium]